MVMFLVIVQGIALVLQTIAAILALRLIGITRRWIAWALIAAAIALIVFRRSLQFFPIKPIEFTPKNATESALLLAISVLLVVGIALIAPLFLSMRQTQQELRQARDELEERVKERTAELSAANAQLTREVAERRRAEQALVAKTAELERSNRELEQFAYVASHDLQEPLRKIVGFGDRLEAHYGAALDAEARDYLHRMADAALRMQALIVALLNYARVTTAGKPFEPVDLGEVLTEVIGDLEMRIEQTEAQVEVGELGTVEADPVQMRQLFQNLVGNAIKFHAPERPPVVRVWGELLPAGADGAGDYYQVAVQDNGIGFDEKHLEEIFGVFRRLHGRGEYEGTGIGLAICRKIVERHAGTITADSVPSEGSTFKVVLPCRHGQESL